MKYLLTLLSAFSLSAFGNTIMQEDLIGAWVPSGELPLVERAEIYEIEVRPNMEASLKPLRDKNRKPLVCLFKESKPNNSIYVWYCYINNHHAITLSLSGFITPSGLRLIYGFEYWLGGMVPGGIHGGVPVSYAPKTHNK